MRNAKLICAALAVAVSLVPVAIDGSNSKAAVVNDSMTEQTMTMPNVAGGLYKDMVDGLDNDFGRFGAYASFDIKWVSNEDKDPNKSYTVAHQTPEAGTAITKGQTFTVTLYVYSPLEDQPYPAQPGQYVMPDVTNGLYKDMVEGLDNDLGKFGAYASFTIKWIENPDKDPNKSYKVAHQTPVPNTGIDKGEHLTITLYVYSPLEDQPYPAQPGQYVMPDVTNGLYEDMVDGLDKDLGKFGAYASFKIQWIENPDNDPDKSNKVAHQSPVPNTGIDKGESVTITLYVYKPAENDAQSGTVDGRKDKPNVTTVPEVTTKPEATVTTKVTATPAVTAAPEVTTAPEATVTPEVTAAPETKVLTSQQEFISLMYTNALGRDYDEEGLAYWTESVANGTVNASDLARAFLCSPEFLEKDMKNDEFIDQVYNIALGRGADDEGKKYWNEQLTGGMERVDMINRVLDCPEWCELCASYGMKSGALTAKASNASEGAKKVATDLYTVLLNREPEEEGLTYWAMSLTNGEVSCADAIKAFVYSDEYASYGYDKLTFVTQIYSIMLGREPDEEGLAYWVDNMTEYADVIDGFSGAPEFIYYSNSNGLR